MRIVASCIFDRVCGLIELVGTCQLFVYRILASNMVCFGFMYLSEKKKLYMILVVSIFYMIL